MWIDGLHDDRDSWSNSRKTRSSRAVADFARLQQDVIHGAKKKGESPEKIIELIEQTILCALIDEKRFK